MGARLSKARKEELAEKALAMSVKGCPVTEIREELEVSWQTANSLVDFALKKRKEAGTIDEDAERERSIAHHRGIIKWCWEQLEDEELGKFAQNRPAYVARIQHSQGEIDKLNGTYAPTRSDNTHRHEHEYLDLSDVGDDFLEELYQRTATQDAPAEER